MAEHQYRLRGEIDRSNAREVQAQLEDAFRRSRGDVVIDCSELDFVDSFGVSALLLTQCYLAGYSRSFRLTNASASLQLACEMMGLTLVLRLDDANETILFDDAELVAHQTAAEPTSSV